MKLGVIARSEDRGLGNQTWEVCRALRPERVLVVDMDDLGGGFPAHPQRYVDLGLKVTVVHHSEMHRFGAMRPWLSGLDVVYTAETFYSPSFVDFANAEGVRTVCHLNPEFHKHWNEPSWTQPTEWWLPSPWLADHPRMPKRAHLMPMPVPSGFERRRRHKGDPVRFLHVAGKPAMGDRNGTRNLFMALRHVRERCEVHVRAQAQSMPHPSRLSRTVSYYPHPGNVGDYRRMYAGFDVLVMPRRYGGLCLPVLEASAAGMGVVMSDCSPNEHYPALLVPVNGVEKLKVPLGEVDAYDTDPVALAGTLDALAANDDALIAALEIGSWYADALSWENQAELWDARLRHVCNA